MTSGQVTGGSKLVKLNLPCRRERGAATVLIVLLLGSGVLLGMGALVVDVGKLYVERESLQTGADAAGMAVATACAQGNCVGATAVAQQLARAQDYATRARKTSPDVHTEVTELCGRWDSLRPCDPASAARGLGRCLGVPAAGDKYLEVRVRTQNNANTSVLPPTFGAAVLGGQYRGTAVTACARYTARVTQAVPALWATGTSPTAITLNGGNTTVTGLVHSNADILINGNGNRVSPRIEYVTTFTNGASGATLPTPVRVSASTLSGTADIADYRPGGSIALAAGTNYTAIPLTSCSGRTASGVWDVPSNRVPSGLVYVPCGATIHTAGIVNATIVAEGPITLNATGITVNPWQPSGLALLSNSNATWAIDISGGSDISINGGLQAPLGGAYLRTSNDYYKCGVVAKTILVESNGGIISTDPSCTGGSGLGTRLTG